MPRLKQGDGVEQWPLPQAVLQPLTAGFTTDSDEPLQDARQRLLIGPHALPAPPWGSVWLDKESVLFGDSTLALRQWMRENSVVFSSGQNEPEDHFGALLLLAAWLAEQGNRVACDQLLALASAAVGRAFSHGIQQRSQTSLLACVGVTGATHAGGLAIPVADPGRTKTAFPLMPSRSDDRDTPLHGNS